MFDPDISTEDARRLLSVPERDDIGSSSWSRRRFLQAVGAGLIGGAALSAADRSLFGLGKAWAAPIGATDGILVTIMMYGGNDGLNTVVPYTNSQYYARRGGLAIPANQVLPLDATFGLHPNLPYLKGLWDAGQLGIVHGVGYPNPDLSHFTSMALWMQGRYGGSTNTGWIGRWLDSQPGADTDVLAATIGTSVPLHMAGAVRRAVAIPEWGDLFGTETEPSDLRMYNGLRAMSSAGAGRGQWHDMFARTLTAELNLASDVAPVFAQPVAADGLPLRLTIAARLLNANLGLRVIDAGIDGFDTHDNQPSTHNSLMTELNAGISAFYATLAPQFRDRVTILTMSEFGRTLYSNDSAGTDHGTANVLFVMGAGVKGGHVGQAPSLNTANQWERLASTVDFRSVLGSVVDGWMGGGGNEIVAGSFEPLGLFKAGPGGTPPPPDPPPVVLPPSEPSAYTPMTPVRLFDTRNGVGGRLGRLGGFETWTFAIRGKFGVPANAIAVALNITSTDATDRTYVTVWPGGTTRPTTSNLNASPGVTRPNMVVVPLGLAGDISLFNSSGGTHLVGDLVGYFAPDGGAMLEPMTPVRILDTRDGTGGFSGPIGPKGLIDLNVAGVSGVPADCRGVALNVTVVNPTATSYLTVWPSGATRPGTSSLNMRPGVVVPNMVMSSIGEDGRISLYNNAGSTDVVVDVLGCFHPDATGKFVGLPPARALDTRNGTGVPKGQLAQSALQLKVTGVAGVPASGVGAVLMNVTAVAPTTRTYLTVYPTGQPRPLASNLNAPAGAVVPNMVVARVGTDGGVMFYNGAGAIDVVADVVGYFTT